MQLTPSGKMQVRDESLEPHHVVVVDTRVTARSFPSQLFELSSSL